MANIEIGGRLHSTATGNVVAGANEVLDDDKNKKQSDINAETDAALENRYTKEQTYSKSELNNLITTPNQQYVSVTATAQTTSATDVLPATGAANTVYRVGNWDGSQFDASVYSEYAWNGSQYVHLSTKTQIGEVFDISAYHATGGELAKYADLAAALDSNNGGGIPQSLQKGGMSIKFVVQSSDNKYVQWRYLLEYADTTEGNAAFINPDNWQGVDKNPIKGSKNLIESGAVYKVKEAALGTTLTRADADDVTDQYIGQNGTIAAASHVKTYFYDNSDGLAVHVNAILASEVTNQLFIAFYNSTEPSSSTLISGVNTVIDNDYELDIDVPLGCKLIAIANNKTIIENPDIEIIKKSALDIRLTKAETEIDGNTTDIQNINAALIDKEAINGVAGNFQTNLGALSPSDSYNTTTKLVDGQTVFDYLPVSSGDVISYNGTTLGTAKAILGWDAWKQNPTVLLDNPTYGTVNTITIPQNIRYVTISYRNTEGHDIAIYRGYNFASKESFEETEEAVKGLTGNILPIESANAKTKQYISSNGELYAASGFNCYYFYNTEGLISEVSAFVANVSPNAYEIAFYSSTTPSSSTFISGVATVESDGHTVTDIVPKGTKLIIIANKLDRLSNPTAQIHKIGSIGKIKEGLDIVKEGYAKLLTGSIVTNINIGDTVDLTVDTSTGIVHCVLEVKRGDIIKIQGHGGYNPRLWAFTDKDYKLLSKVPLEDSDTTSELVLTVENDGYFIYNSYTHLGEYYVYSILQTGETVSEAIVRVEQEIGDTEDDLEVIQDDIDFDFNLFGEYDTFTRPLSWDANCAGLIAKWDTMIGETVGWTKNDTTVDTGLTTPAYQPIPVYIYKHLAKMSYDDRSKHVKVLIYCGEHANEVEGHYVLLDLMRKITTDWANDYNCELACSLIDFYVIPCLNPWGFNSSRVNYNGVNINRNYASSDWKLREQGDNYGGPTPASEFETQTIQWYVDNIKPHITISIHTGNTNAHGVIGTVEYSIDDISKDKQLQINFVSTVVRTDSNMLIKTNNNYPQDLSKCLVDANIYLKSDIYVREESSEVEPYTGLCHFYAVEHGVVFPMLIELNSGSDWENGEYTPGFSEKSDKTYRGNLICLSNLLYRCIKNVFSMVK